MHEGTCWLYLNLADRDVNSFVPAWAAYRGLITTPNISLSEDARRTHLGLTPHLVRLFRKGDAVGLEKELEIERIRRLHYKKAVSRLNCLYCWPDEATARLAPKYWRNQGHHFDDSYLVDIGVSAIRPPTIVDTRWIDKNVINSTVALKEIGTDWIHEYWRGTLYPWNGETDIPAEPLMECLVDGTAIIYGTALRMTAYSIVESIAPESVGVLEKGRLGVDICTRLNKGDEWRLGQIVPMLMSNEERSALVINHFIFIDDALAKRVNEKVVEVGIPADQINHRALEVFKRDTLKLPDLRALDVDLRWISETSTLKCACKRDNYSFLRRSRRRHSCRNKRRQHKSRRPMPLMHRDAQTAVASKRSPDGAKRNPGLTRGT